MIIRILTPKEIAIRTQHIARNVNIRLRFIVIIEQLTIIKKRGDDYEHN